MRTGSHQIKSHKSTRIFVSRVELAINYTRCCNQFFYIFNINLLNSTDVSITTPS